jgi:hypothetical protein
MRKIAVVLLYIHFNYFSAQTIITKCQECIVQCSLNPIEDLSSKEEYRMAKLKRFGMDIYQSYSVENITKEEVSNTLFFQKIKFPIIFINKMDEFILNQSHVKTNKKYKNVINAYVSLVEDCYYDSEEVIQIYIFEMKNKAAANDLFRVIKQGMAGPKNCYILQQGINVVVVFTTFYHEMARDFLECLDNKIEVKKINYGFSQPIKKN